jgi:pyruvate/2-oxoglutarate dehydrogenase complex dihydrolipoamide acyltransferase (E2) component
LRHLVSLQVVVGGWSARPRIVGGDVEVRDVVDLPVTIDHNVVDGAPAARFGAGLRDLIEHATALCELPCGGQIWAGARRR